MAVNECRAFIFAPKFGDPTPVKISRKHLVVFDVIFITTIQVPIILSVFSNS